MLARANNRKFNKIFSFFAGVLLVLSLAGIVIAAQPQTIGIAGRLTNAQGTSLGGDFNFTFDIYNVQAGGSPLWTEIHDGRAAAPTVTVKNGVWSTVLGNNTSLALNWNETYYLQVTITGEVLSPRTAFSSVPYILNATTPADLNFTGTNIFQGTNTFVGASTFRGPIHLQNGSSIINFTMSATNVTTGTLGNARLDTSLAWTNASNVFSTGNTFNGSTTFNRSGIHILGTGVLINFTMDAANITAGTVGNARLDPLIYFMNSTGMNAANITAGTLGNARLDPSLAWTNASNVFSTTNTFNGSTTFNTSGVHFLGSTIIVNFTMSAANITAGTLGNARIDSNLAWVNATQTFTGANTFAGASTFYGPIHLLNDSIIINFTMSAANITAGTVGNARLDTSLAWTNASNVFSTTNTFNGTTTFNSSVHFLGTINFVNTSLTPNNITNTSANTVFADNLIGFYDSLASTKTGGTIFQAGRTNADSTCSGGNVDNTTVTFGKSFSSPLSYYVVAQELNTTPTGAVASSWIVIVKNDSKSFNISCFSTVALGGANATSAVDWFAIGT